MVPTTTPLAKGTGGGGRRPGAGSGGSTSTSLNSSTTTTTTTTTTTGGGGSVGSSSRRRPRPPTTTTTMMMTPTTTTMSGVTNTTGNSRRRGAPTTTTPSTTTTTTTTTTATASSSSSVVVFTQRLDALVQMIHSNNNKTSADNDDHWEHRIAAFEALMDLIPDADVVVVEATTTTMDTDTAMTMTTTTTNNNNNHNTDSNINTNDTTLSPPPSLSPPPLSLVPAPTIQQQQQRRVSFWNTDHHHHHPVVAKQRTSSSIPSLSFVIRTLLQDARSTVIRRTCLAVTTLVTLKLRRSSTTTTTQPQHPHTVSSSSSSSSSKLLGVVLQSLYYEILPTAMLVLGKHSRSNPHIKTMIHTMIQTTLPPVVVSAAVEAAAENNCTSRSAGSVHADTDRTIRTPSRTDITTTTTSTSTTTSSSSTTLLQSSILPFLLERIHTDKQTSIREVCIVYIGIILQTSRQQQQQQELLRTTTTTTTITENQPSAFVSNTSDTLTSQQQQQFSSSLLPLLSLWNLETWIAIFNGLLHAVRDPSPLVRQHTKQLLGQFKPHSHSINNHNNNNATATTTLSGTRNHNPPPLQLHDILSHQHCIATKDAPLQQWLQQRNYYPPYNNDTTTTIADKRRNMKIPSPKRHTSVTSSNPCNIESDFIDRSNHSNILEDDDDDNLSVWSRQSYNSDTKFLVTSRATATPPPIMTTASSLMNNNKVGSAISPMRTTTSTSSSSRKPTTTTRQPQHQSHQKKSKSVIAALRSSCTTPISTTKTTGSDGPVGTTTAVVVGPRSSSSRPSPSASCTSSTSTMTDTTATTMTNQQHGVVSTTTDHPTMVVSTLLEESNGRTTTLAASSSSPPPPPTLTILQPPEQHQSPLPKTKTTTTTTSFMEHDILDTTTGSVDVLHRQQQQGQQPLSHNQQQSIVLPALELITAAATTANIVENDSEGEYYSLRRLPNDDNTDSISQKSNRSRPDDDDAFFTKELVQQHLSVLEKENSTLKELNQKLLLEVRQHRSSRTGNRNENYNDAMDLATADIETANVSMAAMMPTTTEQHECDECMGNLEQLQNRLRDTTMTLLQQSQESTTLTTSLKQTITSLTEQVATMNGQLQALEVVRLNDEHQIQSLHSEMIHLQQIQNQQITDLQIQHEKELQQQYTVIDTKSDEIQNLQERYSILQHETSIVVSDLQEQRNMVEQSELLANELLSVTTERDLLQQSLQESHSEMILLQNMILQNSISASGNSKTEHQSQQENFGGIIHEVDDRNNDETDIIATVQRQQLQQRDTEIMGLTIQVNELQDLLTTKQEIVAELTIHIERLTNNNEELCNTLLHKSETIRELERVVDVSKSTVEMERQKVNVLQQGSASTKEDMDRIVLSQKKALEIESSNELNKVRDQSQQEITKLESKCSTLTSELERYQNRVELFETEKAAMERLLEENKSTILAFEKVEDQTKVDMDNERCRADGLLHDFTSLQQDMEAIKKKSGEVESKLMDDIGCQARYTDELEAKCKTLSLAVEHNHDLADQIEIEKKNGNTLSAENIRIMEEQEMILAQFSDLEIALEQAKDSTVQELQRSTTFERDLRMLRNQLDAITKHRNELQSVVDNMKKNQFKEMELKCLALENEVELYRRKDEEAHSEEGELFLEKARLKEALEAILIQLKTCEDDVCAAKQETEVERTRTLQLEQDMVSIQRELSETTQLRDDLEVELNDASIQLEDLQNQLQRVEELESKCLTLSSEVEHFHSLADTLETEIVAQKDSMLIQFQNLQKENYDSEEKGGMLVAELKSLRTTSLEQISSNEEEIIQLRAVHVLLQEQIDTSSKERDALLQQQRQFKEGGAVQIEIVKQLEQQSRDLLASANQARQDSENERSIAKQLNDDLGLMQQELNVITKNRNELQSEVDDLKKERVDMQIQLKRITELESKCLTLSSEVEHFQTITEAIDKDKAYVGELENGNTRFALENEDMLIQIGALNEQLDVVKESESNTRKELSSIRDAWTEEKSSLVDEMTKEHLSHISLKDHLEKTLQERDALKVEQTSWQKEEEARIEMVKQLEQQSRDLLTLSNQTRLDCENERTRSNQLNDDLTRLQEELNVITNNRNELYADLKELNAKLVDSQNQCQRATELESKCLTLSLEVEQLHTVADVFDKDRAFFQELEIEKSNLIRENKEILDQRKALSEELDAVRGNERILQNELITIRDSTIEERAFHDDEMTKIHSTHISLQEHIERVSQERDTLLSEQAIWKEEQSALIEKAKQLERHYCDMTDAANDVVQKERNRANELNEEVASMKIELKTIANSRNTLESEFQKVNALFFDTQKQLQQMSALKSKCVTLSAEVERFQILVQACEEEKLYIKKLSYENARLTEENDALLVKFDAHTKLLEQREQVERSLSTELDGTKIASANQSKLHAEEVEQLRADVVLLRLQIDAASTNHELVLQQQENWKRQELDLESKITQLQDDRNKIARTLRHTLSKLQTADAALTSQSSIIETLKVSESRIFELESILTERSDQIVEFESRIDNLMASIIQAQNVSITEDDWLELQQEVNAVNEALQSTRDRLIIKEADLDRLNGKLNEIRKQRDDSPTSIVSNEASSPRSTLIAHALQLRRSDSIRVSDLQRLEEEKEATSDVLQRLHESVSRYYTS